MKFSLLYSDISNAKFGNIGSKTLYHLSLDRSFKTICSSQSECQYFLEILSKPLVQERDILYRQEIVSDFLKMPHFFEALKASFIEFGKLKEDAKELKKEIHARNFGIRSSLGGSKESVRDCSALLKRILHYIKDLNCLLSKYPIASEGLLAISRYTSSLVEKEDMNRLVVLLNQAESLCIQSNIGTAIKLDKNGKVADCHLVESKNLSLKTTKEKKRLILRKESATNLSYICLQPPMYSDCQNKLRAYPYLEMENLLTSLITGLIDTFGDLHREIIFYSVVMEYVRLFERKNISLVMPSIGENTQFTEITDVFLAMTNDTDTIDTNDFYMLKDKKGSIVFGDNGNGKTVFLRAISTCQILAQAGMPIPVKSGKIGLFSTIKTQFSESEETVVSNEKMGRFEQEVSELCHLIDTSEGGSLLVLNEIFQTTAYSEGAIGLYHILNYLSAKNIGWILVSHLTDLKEYFKEQNISIYEMEKNHRVTQIQ